MHTLQQTQTHILNTVRSIAKAHVAASARKHVTIVHDSSAGVLVCASIAVVQQVFTQALQQLNAAATANAAELAQLASATGNEDTQINFTYNNYKVYFVSCYTS